MSEVIDSLRQQAEAIKGADTPSFNDAERVGGLFEDIVDYLGTLDPGSGGSGDFDEAAMWDALETISNPTHVIHSSHIPEGSGGGGGGGGSTTGGLTWNDLEANGTRQINVSHMTNALQNYLSKTAFTSASFWGASPVLNNGIYSVSGNMSGVGNLTMSGKLNIGGFEVEKTSSGLKFNGTIYATGGVSAMGASGGGGGGGSTSLNSMLDALNTQNPQPSPDTYLHYINSTSGYEWKAISGGGGTGGDTLNGFLSSLNGFTSPTQVSQGYLYYNGTNLSWSNVSPGGGGLSWSDLTSSGAQIIDRSHIPAAHDSGYGGIKTGYSESGRNFAVKLDNGKAYVTVPEGGGSSGGGSGTVESVGISVPTGFTVSNSPVTVSGTINIGFDTGYSLPTTANQLAWSAKQDAINDLQTIRSNATNGQTAYSWGNHASAGYVTTDNLSTTLGDYVPKSGNCDVTGYLNINGNVTVGTNATPAALSVKGTINATQTVTGTNLYASDKYLFLHSSGYGMYLEGIDSGTNNIASFGWHNTTQNGQAFMQYYRNAVQNTCQANDLYVNNGILSIGNVSLVNETINGRNTLKVVSRDGSTSADFYATGGVSALGSNPISGGGGSVANLYVSNTLFFDSNDGDNYITYDGGPELRICSNDSIYLDAGETYVSVKDGEISCMGIETGDNHDDGNIYVWYNGTKYKLNLQAMLSAGLLTAAT